MYPESFGGKAKEEQAPVSTAKGLIPAFKGAFQELKGQTALTAGKLGLTDEAQAQKYYEAQKAKGYKPTEEGWLEAPFLKTKELIGGSLPYVVAPLLAGVAAEAAPLTGLAALAAGAGATGLASAGQFVGSNLARQMEQGKSLKQTDLGAAALSAIPQAALDVVSLRMMPGLSRLLGVGEDVAKNFAEQGLKRAALDYTMATGKAMGVEGLTESAQQVFERAQAGLSINDPEARKEYFDNFVGGAVLGGTIALPGRKFERMGMQSRYDEGVRQKGYAAAKLEFEKQQAEEDAKAQERAAALEEQKKPENLLKLHDDLIVAQQQVEEMKLARGKRPNAKTSDEDRKKYIEAGQQIQSFVKDTINPLKKARSNFSELIDPLVEERAKNAPPVEEAAPPAPPVMGEAPPVVQQEEQQVPPPTPFAAPKTALETNYPTAVDLIKQSPEPIQNITPMWLSRQLNISPRTSKNILAVMENEGLLTPVEGRPGYFVDQDNPYVPPAKTVTPAAARVSPVMAAADTHYENALAQIKSGTITPTKAAVSKTFGVSDNAAREILDRMVEANILQYDPTTRKYTDPTRVKSVAAVAEETEVAPPADFDVTPTSKATKLAPPVIEPGETIAPAASPYVISQMGGIGKPFQVYGEAGPAPENIAELERNATRTYIESLIAKYQTAGTDVPPALTARLEELNKPAPVPAAPVETPAPETETPAPAPETETVVPETEAAVEEQPAEPEKPAKLPSITEAPAPFSTAVTPIKSDIPTLRDIERGWFHQTSPAGLAQLVNNDGNYHPAGLRVTDNSSFSAGQYDPKSVQIEFRPDSLSGAKQQPLPSGGGIYNTNVIAPQAIQSVSMTKAVEKKLPAKIKSALAQNFDLTTANNGEDFTYTRKKPVKKEAEPAPSTEPKVEKPKFRKAEAPAAPATETPAPAETVEPATEPQTEVTEPVVKRKKRVVKPTAPAQAAVAEETAEPAAPVTTDEQRKKAEAVVNKLPGGKLVWQEGDLALVRAYSEHTGRPGYAPAKGTKYFDWDVDAKSVNFPSVFTPEELAKLRQVKKDLEAADAEKHATDPFIKHDANGLAFSENVPAEYRGIIEGWKKLLGIDARVYVTTIAEARANSDKFTGPHRAIGSAGLDPDERGSARYMSADDSYYITYTPSTSKTGSLEIIAHELGHVHEKNVFKKAPAETQAAIKADYEKWLASNKGKTAREHIEGLRAKTTGKTTEVTEGLQSKDLTSYWSKFGEWYADQVSRWATTTDKPLTVVEKFFAKLAAAMRRFYTNVMQQKYLPAQSIQKFLDGIAEAGEKNGGVAPAAAADDEIEFFSLGSVGPYDNLAEKPTPSIQTKRILNKLSQDYTNGLLTEAEYVARVEELTASLDEAAKIKAAKQDDKEIARGVNRVRQRLSEAAGAEEIDQGAVEFAMWLLQKNPHLADDLAISIKTPGEKDVGARGTYLPFERLMTLFKDKVDTKTAVHEILHHTERMLPFRVQQEIRKEHAKAYAKELARVIKARDEAIRAAIKNGEVTREDMGALWARAGNTDLEGLLDYLIKNPVPEGLNTPVVLAKAVEQMVGARTGNRKAAEEVMTAFSAGILDIDKHYPLTNSSEFWAVNASDILHRRYSANSWQERARNWLRELLQKAKGFFGLRSESPLYKGLDSVIRGDGTFSSKQMLSSVARQFRDIAAPAPSFVESKPTLGSQFKTALTDTYSVAARQKLIDQYASTDFVVKEGQAKGLVSDVQAGNMQYAIRYGQQHNQYAGLALTHGPLTLQKQKTPNGVQFTYESKPGANLMQVAQELEASGLDKKVLEDYFTTMISGQRAMSPGIGWEKLNLENPAQAAQRYKEVMAIINASPQAKAAFAKASDTYRKFNHGLVDFARACGYFTEAVADELKSRPFVPFYRVEKDGSLYMDLDKVSRPVRLGNIKNQPRLIELVGGTEKIKPIFESAAQNAFLLTNLSLGNKARQEVAATLKQVGVISRIAGGKGPGSTNALQFRIDGKDTYAVIDKDTFGIPASLIVQGLEGVTTMVPLAYRIMGIPANLLRKFVTRFPAYALRQALRDPLNAFVTSGADGIPILNSLKQAGKMVAGRGETAKELLEAGAIGNAVFTGDQRDAVRLLEQISTGKSGWTKAMAKLDAFAMAGDALTRASIYEDSISKGFTKQEALLRTLESQNFTRRGTSASMQNAGMMIPFLNAQVQGLDVLYRASGPTKFSKYYRMPFDERVRIRDKFYKRAAMLIGSTAIYTTLMMDDDRYRRAKPEERYGNWFIVNPLDPEGDLIRVPIPFEVGILFKAIPEALINVAFGDETADNALKGMGKLLEQSNPFSFPTFIKPAVEVVLNRSFFGGDIESTRERKLEKFERVRPGTTGTAALLGQAGILSPIQIDHLIRAAQVSSWLTQLGCYSQPSTTMLSARLKRCTNCRLLAACSRTQEGAVSLTPRTTGWQKSSACLRLTS